MSTRMSRGPAALLTWVVIALAGCAAPADKQAMSVEKSMAVAKKHPYAVGVTVRGGTETTATTSSTLSIKPAVDTALRA